MSASFVVQRDGSSWTNREVPIGDALALERLADGSALVGRVVHSDSCYVIGRAPGLREWRWVFGEGGAFAYLEEFDPSGWLTVDDPDDLATSQGSRAAETAAAVEKWAHAWGLAASADEVAKVLAAGYLLAEGGFFALLDTVGIEAPLVELKRDELPGFSEFPEMEEMMARLSGPPRAIAIDHSSPEWAMINGSSLGLKFGEPPCLLRWEAHDYVLSDPPVCVGGGHSLPGQWVVIPDDHCGDFHAAVQWARENVGGPGEPPADPRPVLVLDDPPPSLYGWSQMPLWYLHELAGYPTVVVRLELSRALDGPAAAGLAAHFYDRLVAATVASVGEVYSVTYGADAAEKGWGLLVNGWTSRRDGFSAATKATPTAWARVVERLRRGELATASCSIRRTGAFGAAFGPASCLEAGFALDRPRGAEIDAEPLLLSVYADLPFYANLFPPAGAIAFARAAMVELPVARGYVHVGRWHESTDHWIDIVPAGEAGEVSGFEVREEQGRLTWLQRTVERPQPVVEVAREP